MSPSDERRVEPYMRPDRQGAGPTGLPREIMTGVLDDESNTAVPSKVDSGLDVSSRADIHDVNRISTLHLSGGSSVSAYKDQVHTCAQPLVSRDEGGRQVNP